MFLVFLFLPLPKPLSNLERGFFPSLHFGGRVGGYERMIKSMSW
jgi:hypothetical protein